MSVVDHYVEAVCELERADHLAGPTLGTGNRDTDVALGLMRALVHGVLAVASALETIAGVQK